MTYTAEILQNTTVEKTLYLILGVPVLIKPVNSANIIYAAGSFSFTNYWYKLPGADTYEIAISINNDLIFDVIKLLSTTNYITNYTGSI